VIRHKDQSKIETLQRFVEALELKQRQPAVIERTRVARRDREQPIIVGHSLSPATKIVERVAAALERRRKIALQLKRGAKGCDRIEGPPQRQQGQATIDMSLEVVRLAAQGFVVHRQRLLEPLLVAQRDAEIGIVQRIVLIG